MVLTINLSGIYNSSSILVSSINNYKIIICTEKIMELTIVLLKSIKNVILVVEMYFFFILLIILYFFVN
jgi:hypothetical protein